MTVVQGQPHFCAQPARERSERASSVRLKPLRAFSVRQPINNVRALDKVPATTLPVKPGGWAIGRKIGVAVHQAREPIPLAGRSFPPGSAGGQGGWVGVWTGWPRGLRPSV